MRCTRGHSVMFEDEDTTFIALRRRRERKPSLIVSVGNGSTLRSAEKAYTGSVVQGREGEVAGGISWLQSKGDGRGYPVASVHGRGTWPHFQR